MARYSGRTKPAFENPWSHSQERHDMDRAESAVCSPLSWSSTMFSPSMAMLNHSELSEAPVWIQSWLKTVGLADTKDITL